MTIVEGEGGMFTPDALDAAIRAAAPGDRYAPRPRLVCVEQPTNMGGGRVWPVEQVRAVLDVARAHGLRTHLDGARLMNAVVASGVDAAEWPAGSTAPGWTSPRGSARRSARAWPDRAELIAEAWRWKQMLGGAMRQSGIVAAAGLYALDHHVDRLADDHARARRLAEGLAGLPGVELDLATVETNILVFAVPDAPAFCAALDRAGVMVIPLDARRVRAVTHLDVDDDGIAAALDAAAAALGAGEEAPAR